MTRLCIFLCLLPQILLSEKIFYEDFSDLKSWEYQHSGSPKIAATVDTNIALNDGNSSVLKISFPREAYDVSDMGRRVEIKKHMDILTQWQAERWYAFSIFVPEDHPNVGYHIIHQFHSVEDKGEMPRSPVFMIGMESNGTWGGQIRFSENKIDTFGNKSTVPLNIPWIGGNPKILKGEWTHWVYNIVFDYKADGKGKCRIWIKDSGHPKGEMVVSYRGQIGYPDDKQHYIRMGIYYAHYDLIKWNEDYSSLNLFFDRYLVGDSLENFDSMVYGRNTSVCYNGFSEFKIQPNPASEYIEIRLPRRATLSKCGTSEEIRIFNALGECVLETPVVRHLGDVGHLKRIDISHLPVGIYFLRCGGESEIFVKE